MNLVWTQFWVGLGPRVQISVEWCGLGPQGPNLGWVRSTWRGSFGHIIMVALVCKLSDLETPQLKIYLPICKERSSGLSATAVWRRQCWRQPGGGGVAAALAWRRQCGGGSTYDVLHWAEEVRVRVLPIPAQGSDPCITCVPLNMSCVQKIEEVWFISFWGQMGNFKRELLQIVLLNWKSHL